MENSNFQKNEGGNKKKGKIAAVAEKRRGEIASGRKIGNFVISPLDSIFFGRAFGALFFLIKKHISPLKTLFFFGRAFGAQNSFTRMSETSHRMSEMSHRCPKRVIGCPKRVTGWSKRDAKREANTSGSANAKSIFSRAAGAPEKKGDFERFGGK